MISVNCSWLTFLGKIVRKLLGRNDIDDALKKLDALTMDEARMAITENLNATHSMVNKVTALIESGQEALNVTRRVDDKVSILIDGGQYAFSSATHAFLNMDTARCGRNKCSLTAVSQRRR